MTTYTINVLNQSGVSKGYVVFMPPPNTTSPGGQTPIYTNAWATFESITDGSWDGVTYTPEGPQAADGSPAPCMVVAEGVYTPGQVIDPSKDANTATVDFADRPQTTATVTQHPDGAFTVAYAELEGQSQSVQTPQEPAPGER